MPRVPSLREAAQNEQTFLKLNELLRLSEAENAALKEQVAQLINHNARLESSASAIMDKMQSKSAALVDALEQYATDDSLPYQNTARAALAAFKEQS